MAFLKSQGQAPPPWGEKSQHEFSLLFADDEEDNLLILVELFQRDYETFASKSGPEALEIFKENSIDLVLTDQRMPGMSGVELIQNIFVFDPDSIRILITGYTDHDALKEAVNTGQIYSYITKPWEADELKMIVKRALERRRIAIENKQLLIELQNTIEQIKETNVELRNALAIITRFVPAQIQQRIAKEGIQQLETPRTEEGTATVLISDLRGFTALAEALNPTETLRFLNDLMTPMVPIIQSHGGFVHQFVGDEIMAIFYAGEGVTADGAVQAAIEMHKTLNRYNDSRSAKGLAPVGMGIGLHTGRVITGTIGDRQRMDAAIIGDTVNLASRLEGLNKQYGVNLLASEATIQSLKSQTAYSSRLIDLVRVVGKNQPVEVFEIFDADPEEMRGRKARKLRDYHKGIELYRLRRWKEAGECFQLCQAYSPDDPVVQLYLERCTRYEREPPPADWDGAITLDEK